MAALDLTLQLSSSRVEKAKAELAQGGYARISGVLTQAVAERLRRHLTEELAWARTFNPGERVRQLEAAELAALPASAREALGGLAQAGADRGFRYLYDVVRSKNTATERLASGLLLDRLIETWNQSQALDLWRQLSGRQEASRLSGSATRYLPGHFLTTHNDHGDDRKRMLAYVLNLSPEWRADWGGLLQFSDADGDIIRTLVPRFNTLHLFTVPRDHAVSLVAPFAPAPRLAVSGWVERD